MNLLHDGGEEGLRVEEAGEPDGGRQLEVAGPTLQFLDSLQHVGVPLRQAVQRRVGALRPALGNHVHEQRVAERLHRRRDGQLALAAAASSSSSSSNIKLIVLFVMVHLFSGINSPFLSVPISLLGPDSDLPSHGSSSPSINTPFSLSITFLLFHSQLKTYLFRKFFPP